MGKTYCDKCQPGCVQSEKPSTFGKARIVSTLQARSTLRDLTGNFSSSENNRRLIRYGAWWLNLAAGSAIPMVATLALVWLATISLVVISYFVPFKLVSLVYLLPVVVAATQWGTGPGIVAAVAGAAAADFFFYPPLYTLWVRDPENVVDLILFLLVALVTSNLAARLKNEAIALRRREKEIGELHAFSQGLATCLNSRDLIFAVQDYLSNTLHCRAILIATVNDDCEPNDQIAVPQEIRQAAAGLAAPGSTAASTVVECRNAAAWLVRVITPEILGYGAIAVELGRAGESKLAVAQRVETLLDEAISTLKHLQVKEAIEQATISYRAEILRDALVGGVSHELRSPLASILGSCSVLNQMPAIAEDRRTQTLVEAIHDQAGRLDNQIRDLLDATRISAKGVRPQLAWTDPTDIVNAALKQKERRLARHWVTVDVARDVPLIQVDSVLIEQALGQLLENAAKYSPVGSDIKIGARCEDNCLVFSVRDQGSGLTADEKGQLGRQSFRGNRQPVGGSGSGLGLWIASTFVAANGGSLYAESSGANLGATISLRLPLASTAMPELTDALND